MSDLKLMALDSEDLEVISAHIQDAVVRVGDMGFAKADRRFALLVNRYAWEAESTTSKRSKGAKGQRKRTALHFDNVDAAELTGIDIKAREGVLELLSVTFEPGTLPQGVVTLCFAGGGTVRLNVECLEAKMRDLGAAWAASGRPAHEIQN